MKKELEFGTDTFNQIRKHWKYSSDMNGIAGAPIFYGNGVRIDGAEDYGYKEWI